jgi:flagellar hook-associated protein 2
MASITSLGVGSGLDLSSIVNGLVDAERVPSERALELKTLANTSKLSAFGALRSSLSLFQSSLSSLQLSNTYGGKETSVSDDSLFSSSAIQTADIGSYSIEVKSLAQTQSLATSALNPFNDVDQTIGTGTLTIAFGTTSTGPYDFTQDTSKSTQDIVVSAENNNTTLSGFRDYINNNDYGFQASIINDGSGFRLVLTGDDSGSKNSLQITATNDGDADNNDNSGLSRFAFNASAQTSLLQTVDALDASLSVNGLDITRENNSITGVIDGVTLDLKKAEIGAIVTLDVTQDQSSAKAAINEFVDGFNGLAATITSLTDYNTDTEQGGILIGDFTVRNLTNQLRNSLFKAPSSNDLEIGSLSDLGISTQSDGSLKIDNAKLDAALSSNAKQVEALFINQGRTTDQGIEFLSAPDGTAPGSYAVDIQSAATQGSYQANTLNSLIIDSNNSSLIIKVDGFTSDTITLTEATYLTGGDLATEIEAKINEDSSLKSAGVSVNVSYDLATNKLSINSSNYGPNSTVEITDVGANTATDLGISAGIGSIGSNVVGTINGLSASGVGRILTSTLGASNGVSLNIPGSAIGNRGSVVYSDGLLGGLSAVLDNLLKSDGAIASRETGLNQTATQIAIDKTDLEDKITKLEASLVARFSLLDGLLARFNSTSDFLTQQLDSFVKPNAINGNN